MLRTALWIGFLLRLLVAIWNGFFGPSFGAEFDPVGFHFHATEYSYGMPLEGFDYARIYPYVLGMIYSVTTESLFWGSFLSVLAWLASAFILVRVMRLLSIDKRLQSKAMLIYALLPSSILFTAVTHREPYQLLFVNLAIYAVLKIYLKKSILHWLILICAVAGMAVLHISLFAFGLFIVIAALTLLALRRRKGFSVSRLAFVTPLIVLVVIYGSSLLQTVSVTNLGAGADVAIELYQQGGLLSDARAQYRTSIDINGIGGLLLFIPVALFQYLFEPMPWRVSGTADAELLLENLLRAWLIWKALIGLRAMPGPGRRPALFVFLSYLVIETIWSVGTLNWGTAARHHIPSIGLLVIAAFAYAGSGFKRSKSNRVSVGGRVEIAPAPAPGMSVN